jgi:hypothetical protein
MLLWSLLLLWLLLRLLLRLLLLFSHSFWNQAAASNHEHGNHTWKVA